MPGVMERWSRIGFDVQRSSSFAAVAAASTGAARPAGATPLNPTQEIAK